jgi:hypothetical protein
MDATYVSTSTPDMAAGDEMEMGGGAQTTGELGMAGEHWTTSVCGADIVKKVRSPFLRKLWAILEDVESVDAISWDYPLRQSFTIHSAKLMERDVLPRFFKSHLFNSFQRQLNYFGFCKLGKEGFIYYLELFRADAPGNLLMIKRKVNTGNLTKSCRKKGGKAPSGTQRRRKSRYAPYEENTVSAPSRPTHSRSGRTISWVNKENQGWEESMEEESSSEEDDKIKSEICNGGRPTLALMAPPMPDNAARQFDDLDRCVGHFPSASSRSFLPSASNFYVHDPLLPPCTPITPTSMLFQCDGSSSSNPFITGMRGNLESPTTTGNSQLEPDVEPNGEKCEPKVETKTALTRQPSFTRSLSLTTLTKEIWGEP